jgi:methylglutaconyl-CoA hydratase
MQKQVLLSKVVDSIALLTLIRPEASNALSLQMLSEINEILETLKNDSSVRCVIVTGKGEKAFCAGADLKERSKMNSNQVRQTLSLIRGVMNTLEALPMPVIAAVNGVALGGGTELALASDIRIAADTALFGLSETGLGIIPGAGGTQRLPRLIGKGRAKELIYTAKKISAHEAEKIGLVEYVVSVETFMDKVLDIAKKIARNGPIAVAQAKIAINKGLEVDLQTGLVIEQLAYEKTIPTKDRLEGLNAFKEKRQPMFNGE